MCQKRKRARGSARCKWSFQTHTVLDYLSLIICEQTTCLIIPQNGSRGPNGEGAAFVTINEVDKRACAQISRLWEKETAFSRKIRDTGYKSPTNQRKEEIALAKDNAVVEERGQKDPEEKGGFAPIAE